jgi:uncharacterized protein (DUF697 family)
MGLPVRSGINKMKGLQKTLKAVRNEVEQAVSIVICSDSVTETEIISLIIPFDGKHDISTGSLLIASCRIADAAKRAVKIRQSDLLILAITSKMSNEQIARMAIDAAGAKNRLVMMIDRDSKSVDLSKLAQTLNTKEANIIFVKDYKAAGVAAQLAVKILDAIPDKVVALGATLPLFRDEVEKRIIMKAAKQNAFIGVFIFMPGADMPLLTMNQIRMVMQLSALYNKEISLKRLYEVTAVTIGGFAFRELARELLGLIPVLGWALKGAIAYIGTIAVGHLAVTYLKTKRNIPTDTSEAKL